MRICTIVNGEVIYRDATPEEEASADVPVPPASATPDDYEAALSRLGVEI